MSFTSVFLFYCFIFTAAKSYLKVLLWTTVGYTTITTGHSSLLNILIYFTIYVIYLEQRND